MKKILAVIAISFAIAGIASAQYVSTVLQDTITAAQQRIKEDRNNLNVIRQDINAQEQLINSIMNDTSATAITADVPAIAAIQAAQSAKVATPAQPVGAKTAEPAVNSTGD